MICRGAIHRARMRDARRTHDAPGTTHDAPGFTLLEIIIAMGIAASIMASVMGAMTTTDASRMASFSGDLVRVIRYCYNQAALTNTYYRLNFDLEENNYLVEYSDTPFYIVKEDDEAELIRKTNEGKSEQTESDSDVAGKGDFAESEDEFLEIKDIPSGIKVADIQAQHQKEKQITGKAYLYFFPRGRTEFAVLHISDEEDEQSLTLGINPLTANVSVMDDYIEYEDVLEEMNKAVE